MKGRIGGPTPSRPLQKTAGVVGAIVVAALTMATTGFVAKATTAGSAYTAVSPCRILDTRTATGPTAGMPVSGGSTLDVAVTGTFTCGSGVTVPANATAVVMNLTVTAPTANGFIALYPTGTPSSTSDVNFNTGQTWANLTTTQVSSGGKVTVSDGQPSASSTVHVILDLEGYYGPQAATSTAGQYVPLPTPQRITDTRASSGCPNAGQSIGAGNSLTVQVTGAMNCSAGASGIPSSGVTAIVFNLTATDVSQGTFLTAFAQGGTRPTASNLNLPAGDTRPNRVIVPVNSSNGQVSIFNDLGTVDVVVDANGYYTDSTASATAGSLFTPIAPTRFEDTRTDGHTIPNMGTLTLQIGGALGVPANATAAVENVTDDNATQASYFTVWPGGTRPLSSDLNFAPGLINPNMVQTTLDSSGNERIFNCCGSADAIVDVFGYFAPSSSGPPPGNQTYTVSGPSPGASMMVSTGTAMTAGQVTYTVTGFNSTNTPSGHVDIALFPATGANAPVNMSGTWTFTSSAGTGMAGAAAGEATSNNQTSTSPSSPNQAPSNVPMCGVSQSNCFGYISSVMGSATSNEPDLVKDVTAASGGTLTFTLNSFQQDAAVPVVFSEPGTADTGTLQLGTNAQPAAGYPFGVGGAVTWSPAMAASGTYTNWIVQSVSNSTNTFSACDQNKSQCSTFSDGASGDTFMYIDPATSLSQSGFQAVLSGPVTQSNGLPAILGDEFNSTYSSSGSSSFTFSNSTSLSSPGTGTGMPSGQADVPGAPTGLAASTSMTPAGTQLSWTDPGNQDVTMDSTSTHKVYRAPVTGGTVGTYATVTTSPCATPAPTCLVDTSGTVVAGQQYSYVVSAVSGTGSGNVATEGPASAAVMYTLPAVAPISISTTENAGTNMTLVATVQLKVVFNEAVTIDMSNWTLVVTDGTNVNTLSSANHDSVAQTTTTTTNDTLTYQVGAGGPVITHGAAASLTNLEALTQTGVTAGGNAWNMPGSGEATADGGSTAASGQDRVWSTPTAGSNSSLPGGPTASASADMASTVNVTACTGTDAISVYKSDGTNIGPTTPVMCASGKATVTTTQAMTAGQQILVTQQASNGYESLASPVTVAAGTIMVMAPATAPTAGTAVSPSGFTLTAPNTLPDGTYTLCVGAPGSSPCSQAGSPAQKSPNGTAWTPPAAMVQFTSHMATVGGMTFVTAGSGTLYFTVSGGSPALTAPFQGSVALTVNPGAVDTAFIPAGSNMCLTSSFTSSALTQPATPSGNATQTEMGTPPPAACFLNPPSGISIQALDQFGNNATGSGMVNVVDSDSGTNVAVCSAVSASCSTNMVTITISGGTGTLYLWINSTSAISGITLTFSQMTPPTPNNMYKQVTTISD